MKFTKLISYILHPIVVPIIGTILYFILIPRHINKQWEMMVIGAVFVCTYLLPLLFLSLLKKSKSINSFHLVSPRERKFPVLFFVSISLLMASLIKKGSSTYELALFFYGMTIALIITYFLLYRNFKASLHMIGIGGMIGFFITLSIYYQINLLLLLSILFVMSGIIANSRLSLNAHSKTEILIGFLIGICCQFAIYSL
ncbi:hypothetical protein [Urechidicola vernalis]|uniref:PAP2 family protein n=1 Tax=Urechidicola vernalis TaxID=3075600 RepID=A0ABU2Y5Z1_9FLAO|nr:hypothetical protein [Urechidicola sp. P050]MDT0553185.1 hypothetical protein [Urechidicola sp. P050]